MLKKCVLKLLILVLLYFDSDLYKIQKVCDKVVSSDRFMLKYCLDRYKTQEMSEKTANDFLPAIKFVPHRFVTSKMIKKFCFDLFANDDLLFFNKGSDNVTFSSN